MLLSSGLEDLFGLLSLGSPGVLLFVLDIPVNLGIFSPAKKILDETKYTQITQDPKNM